MGILFLLTFKNKPNILYFANANSDKSYRFVLIADLALVKYITKYYSKQLGNLKKEVKMDEKFRHLIEIGAGEFEHADGSLINHLEGTKCLLKAWKASEVLQNAGLYHAAYGRLNFKNMFDLSHRKEVAGVIGHDEENIVYHYCTCDKNLFFAQFGQVDLPVFYNRITTKKSVVSNELLQQLCELNAANKTELAINDPVFVTRYSSELADLFSRMHAYLSSSAKRKIQHVFTSHS